MAFKANTDNILRFDSKPLSWRNYVAFFTLGACLFAIIVIIFNPTTRYIDFLSANLSTLVIGCVIFIGTIWYSKRRLNKNYLVLTDTELKPVNSINRFKEFSIPWQDVKLVQISRNRKDKVTSLSILMQSGKLWNVSGYTDMDEIAKQVTKHVKADRLDGILNSVRTKPWILSFVFCVVLILALLGWRHFLKQVPITWSIFPLVVLVHWLYLRKIYPEVMKRRINYYSIFCLLVFSLIVIISVFLYPFTR